MKKSDLVLGLTLLTLLVVAAMAAARVGFRALQDMSQVLDAQTRAVLFTAIGVTLLCTLLIAYAISCLARRVKEVSCRAERERAYEALLEALITDLETGANRVPMVTSLFLTGSTLVLKEYRAWVRLLAANAADEVVRNQLNRLILVMRRDLGESTFGLENEDWTGWIRGGVTCRQPGEQTAPGPAVSFALATPAHRL